MNCFADCKTKASCRGKSRSSSAIRGAPETQRIMQFAAIATALATLKITWQLGLSSSPLRQFGLQVGAVCAPEPPKNESDELRLRARQAEQSRRRPAGLRHPGRHRPPGVHGSAASRGDRAKSFWEQMAAEAEQAKVALEKKLAEQQSQAAAQPTGTVAAFVSAAASSCPAPSSLTRRRRAS